MGADAFVPFETGQLAGADMVIFSWCMLRYLRSGSKKALLSGAALIGLCVTVKYNGAILCLPLALAVIYRALRVDKRPCTN